MMQPVARTVLGEVIDGNLSSLLILQVHQGRINMDEAFHPEKQEC